MLEVFVLAGPVIIGPQGLLRARGWDSVGVGEMRAPAARPAASEKTSCRLTYRIDWGASDMPLPDRRRRLGVSAVRYHRDQYKNVALAAADYLPCDSLPGLLLRRIPAYCCCCCRIARSLLSASQQPPTTLLAMSRGFRVHLARGQSRAMARPFTHPPAEHEASK